MTNPVRIQQIRKATLSALAMSGNYALPIDTLWGFVSDLVKPPLSFGEKGVTEKWLVDGEKPVSLIMKRRDAETQRTDAGKNVSSSILRESSLSGLRVSAFRSNQSPT